MLCISASVYGIFMLANSVARRRLLDEPAAVHHGDLVGVAGDDAEVVGDEDHRHVAVAALLAEQVEDLRLHGDVERGGRLVGEQQRRAAGQGDGDHHPLAHAARQLVRVLAAAGGAASGMRTSCSSRSAVAARVARRSCRGGSRSGSAICSPIFISGLSERHRVLEDHRHLPAPDRGASACGRRSPGSPGPRSVTEPDCGRCRVAGAGP